ncbi:DUF4147 domain-containing protein [candidate division WWE3 bacterium]|uniref:DUF4147 domain-containing protein n=1 Tax=candidate division WWE3 bacterium TaxID=2053526 RepID=A0A955LGB6_UNCKA|nr:DUF4147 domain-containing protein [candidate division WWE3 bacterium]
MIIKNFDSLAKTPLRKDALTIVEAGFEAIQTDHVIEQNISLSGSTLSILEQTYDLDNYENIYVIAFGKSSYQAAQSINAILGDKITKGYAIGVTGGDPVGKIVTVAGTHPSPSDINHRAAQQIIELLSHTTEKDLVLAFISGGGSALFAAPYKLTVDEQAMITNTLMKLGADIHELNIVRKHISEVKGGRLASLASPAKLVTVIFSDVPGNDLSTIASGSTVLDESTVEDAQRIIDQYDLMSHIDLDAIELSESPKDPAIFTTVDNILILDPTSAVIAMKQKAEELGYQTEVYATELQGEARSVGKELLEQAKSGVAVLASGETTVNVLGNGIGGRNQELVLANLQNINKKQVLISAASDGHDHSDSAGAIADEHSYDDAKGMNLDPKDFLETSDSFTFFTQTGDLLDTGLLESNIADMYLVLQK